MTTPILFSDQASNPTTARVAKDGSATIEATNLIVPSGTVNNAVMGIFRFQPGFFPAGVTIRTTDLDSGTTVLCNIGYVYDNTVGENQSFFVPSSTFLRTASVAIWPANTSSFAGSGFVATDSGYISITLIAGPTNVLGNIFTTIIYSYNA